MIQAIRNPERTRDANRLSAMLAMPNNGWQYLESVSHEYTNAAQLDYYKDNRIATINLSINPLNNTCVVVISIGS